MVRIAKRFLPFTLCKARRKWQYRTDVNYKSQKM